MKPAKAEGCLLVNPGKHAFSGVGAVFTSEAAHLECNPVPVENGIELVKGQPPWPSGADQRKVTFGEVGLNGRRIEWLKQLRLEQLTDSGDLMAR